MCACEQDIFGESSMYRPAFDTDTHYVRIGSVMVLSQNQVNTGDGVVTTRDGVDPQIAIDPPAPAPRQSFLREILTADRLEWKTHAKLWGLIFVLVGILAGIFYGLYLLGTLLWCDQANASSTDYCIDRGW